MIKGKLQSYILLFIDCVDLSEIFKPCLIHPLYLLHSCPLKRVYLHLYFTLSLSLLLWLSVWCAVGRHRWFVLSYVINVGLSGSTQPKLERFHHSLQGYPQAGCTRGRIGRWEERERKSGGRLGTYNNISKDKKDRRGSWSRCQLRRCNRSALRQHHLSSFACYEMSGLIVSPDRFNANYVQERKYEKVCSIWRFEFRVTLFKRNLLYNSTVSVILSSLSPCPCGLLPPVFPASCHGHWIQVCK